MLRNDSSMPDETRKKIRMLAINDLAQSVVRIIASASQIYINAAFIQAYHSKDNVKETLEDQGKWIFFPLYACINFAYAFLTLQQAYLQRSIYSMTKAAANIFVALLLSGTAISTLLTTGLNAAASSVLFATGLLMNGLIKLTDYYAKNSAITKENNGYLTDIPRSAESSQQMEIAHGADAKISSYGNNFVATIMMLLSSSTNIATFGFEAVDSPGSGIIFFSALSANICMVPLDILFSSLAAKELRLQNQALHSSGALASTANITLGVGGTSESLRRAGGSANAAPSERTQLLTMPVPNRSMPIAIPERRETSARAGTPMREFTSNYY